MVFFLFSACTYYSGVNIKSDVNIRCSIIPATTGYIKCSVFFEGPDGNSVSGALINVSDSSNQVISLIYNYNSCYYEIIIEENTDTYLFEINSILLNEPCQIAVPYTTITKNPDVTFFQDSEGNSVLNGQYLKAALPVQISWLSSGENILYQITIKTAFRTIYAVTTNAENITIPDNKISQGLYTLNISAQKIYGDPAYKTYNYYSLSTSSIIGISFNVQ
jgi:hypothetical protein